MKNSPHRQFGLRFAFGLVACFALSLTVLEPRRASAETPEQARKELAQLRLDYTTDSFLSVVKQGDKIALGLFLDAGMDVNAQDANGFTALFVASKEGNTNLANLLLSNGADLNHETKSGVTALLAATCFDHPGIASALIAKGATVNVRDPSDGTPLEYATEHHEFAVVTALLQKAAELDTRGTYGRTPLHVAAESGYLDLVKLYCERNAKVNLQDDAGLTPLMAAVRNGHADVAKYLIEKGANLNLKDASGNTALDISLLENPRPTVELLLNAGAKADVYVRKLIDDVATQVRENAVNSIGANGGSLDAARALALTNLAEFKTSRVFDDNSLKLARTNFVDALKDAVHLDVVRFRSSRRTDRDVQVDRQFAALMEEILPGSAGDTSRLKAEAGTVAEKVADPTLIASISLTPSTPLTVVNDPLNQYDRDLVNTIRQQWADLLEKHEIPQQPKATILVEFCLHSDGKISDLKISGGNTGDLLSKLCETAVLDPTPYPKWPPVMKQRIGAAERTAKITFIYEK